MQPNETCPLRLPTGVRRRAIWPVWPGVRVRVVGFAVMLKAGVATVTGTELEIEPVKFMSPE